MRNVEKKKRVGVLSARPKKKSNFQKSYCRACAFISVDYRTSLNISLGSLSLAERVCVCSYRLLAGGTSDQKPIARTRVCDLQLSTNKFNLDSRTSVDGVIIRRRLLRPISKSHTYTFVL